MVSFLGFTYATSRDARRSHSPGRFSGRALRPLATPARDSRPACVDALAHQWGMTPAKTEELLDEFAALGLIDTACWEEGLIRIQSVADRFMYKEGKAAAQRESVASRRANKAASAAP